MNGVPQGLLFVLVYFVDILALPMHWRTLWPFKTGFWASPAPWAYSSSSETLVWFWKYLLSWSSGPIYQNQAPFGQGSSCAQYSSSFHLTWLHSFPWVGLHLSQVYPSIYFIRWWITKIPPCLWFGLTSPSSFPGHQKLIWCVYPRVLQKDKREHKLSRLKLCSETISSRWRLLVPRSL